MGWLFRRRSAGRHSLGAAVTSIPTALPAVAPLPPVPIAAAPPPPLVSPVAPFVPPPRQEPVVLAVAPPVQAPAPAPVVIPPAALSMVEMSSANGPRVELGFTDGSFRTLDPASSQARALEELARSLITRG